MLIKYQKEPEIFWYQEGFLNTYAQISSDTTLIMLESTMYLAIILLLVWYRCQSHWSDGKHKAKVQIVN